MKKEPIECKFRVSDLTPEERRRAFWALLDQVFVEEVKNQVNKENGIFNEYDKEN